MGSPRRSSLVLPLLSGTGCSVYHLTSNTESCDEDDDEVGVGVIEELVDKPVTPNGTSKPVILAELPERKNCGSFFKKHNFDK